MLACTSCLCCVKVLSVDVDNSNPMLACTSCLCRVKVLSVDVDNSNPMLACTSCLCCVKVLSVDVDNSKLLLTHKKSLLNSKMAAVTSYAALQYGMTVEGCVVSIKSSGLVVTFYNGVKVDYAQASVYLVKLKWTMLHKRAYVGAHLPLLGLEPIGGEPPMSMTCGQCDARPRVTFPAARHHRLLAGTKIYCLVTEAHVC